MADKEEWPLDTRTFLLNTIKLLAQAVGQAKAQLGTTGGSYGF